MVRVTHGKYTKAVSKKMRPAEEEEDEEEAEDSEEEEYEEEASGEDSDGDEEGGEQDDEEDKPPKSDDEAAADEGEDEEERPAKKKKARKRNQFVDDVAEEDDDEDDDTRASKKKKKSDRSRSAASAFIDDIAEVEDDEDGDDESDGDAGDEELDEGEREAVELEAQQRVHARYQNMENMERLENEEELEKRLKERYAAHRAQYEGDGVADVVDQQALHPTVRDPKLWMVTVKQGKERETVVCLMQKAVNLHKTGKGSMAIKSAVVQDHLKSYVYVEAEREDHVKKALAGMRHVYHMKPIRLVPIKEMVDSITVTKKKVENIVIGSWVRMRGGAYKGDLARVIDTNYADNQCTVKLVPRFDYAHLRAKEEGTAAGRAKKDSSMRPPARLFTEAEARKHNLSFERSRQDRRLGDVVDVLCGVHKLKDGYYVKTISMASCKLSETPALDELQRYSAGEEATEAAGKGEGGGANADANLEKLAASLGGAKTQRDQNFRPGDQVVIVKGDLKNLPGKVLRVNPDGSVKMMPQHEALDEALDLDADVLIKSFRIGSHVRCIEGRHEGEAGLVIKVEGEVATVFSDVTKEEFVVFSHHLADSAEVTRRVESLGEYAVHDLAMLEDGSVGMVTRVEKDAAMLMMQSSNPDRPDVRAVRLHDMRRKVMTRGISAVDAQMETIEVGGMCRVVEGSGKGLTVTVQHIWKGTLWGKARDISDHGGIVVVRARNCRIHGANKRDAGAGVGAGSALLRSPAHPGMLSSPSRGPAGAPAPPRGSFGGGRVGRRDNDLIGTTVKVSAGVYKGYKGKIVDATETTVRVELQAQARTVTVQRSQLAGAAPSAPTVPSGAYNPPDAPAGGYGDSARTPMHQYPSTPAYGAGSMTPMRDDGAGGRTPLRDSAWNPTTPAYEPTGWSTDQMGTPGGVGGTPNVYGTPGGPPGTPGSTATPRGFDGAEADAGYDGKFFTGVVVSLADGRQGVVKRRENGAVVVVMGVTKTLPNGESRLEELERGVESVPEASLSLAKPQKKDRVLVVVGEERGKTAELIGVDGTDGVLKMDETQDVSIFHIETLARVWVA